VFKKFFGIFLLTFFYSCLNAQVLDTIKYSLQQKPKFFITLASFNTFIDQQYANIGGVRTGLSYNQRIRFGIGIFNLTNNAVVTPITIKGEPDYITNGQLYLTFSSLSAEYYFFSRYPWQCTVTPFNIGLGAAKYEYVQRPENKKTFTPSEFVILYQPEVSAQYNIFRWLGVGVTTGYRFSLLRSRKQTQNLNAPTFAVDVRLFVDEIYKALF
jgi:hypothetical protein